MATSSLARNHVIATGSTPSVECPPYLSSADIKAYVNTKLLAPNRYSVSGNQVNFTPARQAGETIDIIRHTDRAGLGGNVNTQLLYLSQEAADALAVLGSQDDCSFLWTENANQPPERTFHVFPDGGLRPSGDSANVGGWARARFRFQTSTVGPPDDDPSKSLGWYSCYLDNAATPPTKKHSIYGFSILMRTNAGATGVPPQAGVALQVQTEIAAGQKFGKGEALVVSAKHEDNTADGKLVGVQSTVFPNGLDTGPGDSTGAIATNSSVNYSYSANANGDHHGYCAFIAKSVEDGDPVTKGSGWYNGFVADTDSIVARSFWHVGRFAVVPEGLRDPKTGNPPPFRTARLAIGHDAPAASIHAAYPGVAELRLEDTAVNAGSGPVGNIKFFAKSDDTTPGAPTKEVVRITTNLADATDDHEDCRLNFRTMNNGRLTLVWNMGKGIWSQGATRGDRGLHTVNVGNGLGADAQGYHFAGKRVVGPQIAGWTAWSGSPNRSSFNANSATTAQVAQALKALIDDLMAHGLIA